MGGMRMEEYVIRPIATIRTDFPTKFGVPRQAGIVDALEATVVLEPEYRVDEALRGLEGVSHLWLIWRFSENPETDWSPTVRPPRLGGNRRLGVFATRSPFRPNALGLSCVRLLGIEKTDKLGTVLRVSGADLVDGTPIFDIKPYIPYADCVPDARAEIAPDSGATLSVVIPETLEALLPEGKRAALRGVLANDPRPRYQHDASRIYALLFAGFEIKFSVSGDTLTVTAIERNGDNNV